MMMVMITIIMIIIINNFKKHWGTVIICFFLYLRNCQTESDVCPLPLIRFLISLISKPVYSWFIPFPFFSRQGGSGGLWLFSNDITGIFFSPGQSYHSKKKPIHKAMRTLVTMTTAFAIWTISLKSMY